MNIALYYTHCESLGHTTRVFNIVKSLAKNNANILVFQGGKEQEYFKNQYAKIVNLPNPSYGKHFFHLGNIQQKDANILKSRLALMKKHLDEFKPDIFITELFPLGREDCTYELIPLIKYLKNKYSHIKIYSSIGYPIISQKKEKLLKIAELFDKLIIHCPKELDYEFILDYFKRFSLEQNKLLDQTPEEYKDIFEQLKDKIVFTGYVVNKEKKPKEEEDFVIISRGAGAVHPKIISNGIIAKKYLPDQNLIVVAGPSSSKREIVLFNKLAKRFNKVTLLNHVNDLKDLIAASDVSVSMSGYNTSIETLFSKKQNILFPRVRKDGIIAIEQGYRAELMQKLTGSKILNYATFTPKLLAESIMEKLNNPEKINTKEEWFEGAERTAKIIMSGK